ncbi:MAG TPA: class I SAM-dependent methyltransferase [Oculatellaceae cyanobacterium]|jgi:ubiquinone/menaquinone biosynthesis C-methylase UbiE
MDSNLEPKSSNYLLNKLSGSTVEQNFIKLNSDQSIHYDGKHYDKIYEQFFEIGTEDSDFLIDIANQSGDSVLELCCGTGILSIPIAEKGFQVTGIDISESMLEEARRKSSQVEWVKGDVTNFQIDKKFSLIFFPTNSITHLIDLDSLESCFNCVKKHLKSDGKFVIDVLNFFNKDIINRLFSTQKNLYSIYEDPNGQGTIVITSQNDFALTDQINRMKLFFRFPGQKQEIVEDVIFRYYFPQELAALLKYNGFKIENQFGDYHKSPFTSESPNFILVCSLND